MRKLLVVLSVVIVATATAAAAEQGDVMTPVHQLVDGFNKGDISLALAACADQAFIIDEFPPYQWSGAGACSSWAQAFDADAKKNGITEPVVTLGKPRHVEVVGDDAYVIAPASYAWKQNGKPMKETNSTLTAVLHKTAAGWRITSWTWSQQ